MTLSKELEDTLKRSYEQAKVRRHEFMTLEHILFELTYDPDASDVLIGCGVDLDRLRDSIDNFMNENMPPIDSEYLPDPQYSAGSQFVLRLAAMHAESVEKPEINGSNILISMFRIDESHAVYLLNEQGVNRYDLVRYVSHGGKQYIGQDKPTSIAKTDVETTQQTKDPLSEYCTNLVQKANDGKLDPLIGRESEIDRTIHILARRRKNNPIFVGDAGVGKTAIAEGLALRIAEKKVPAALEETNIYALDIGSLTAGTRYRGDFEERLKAIIDSVKGDQKKVLFIDEIHTIIGAGAVSGGTLDASNMLKPALANGEIRCIGTTTSKEYRSVFEKDHALARRFQKIDVYEPSQEECLKILQGLKKYYEEFHGVRYSTPSLKAAVDLSAKYINDRRLPDKAIDLIDEAGADVKLRKPDSNTKQVTVKDIEALVSKIAKIPTRTVKVDDRNRLMTLSGDLKKVIFGQDEAVDELVTAIQMSRSGLSEPNRPVGNFMFAGPTGVGKTEMAKQLAEALGIEFIRFDMSEYMEKHTVSRLIGSPPGYVGYDEGGQLTEAVHQNPHAVLLLDEIEKAHEDIYNVLLQVMDHATLTDSSGRKIDFRQIVLILTTNTGSRESNQRSVGFGKEEFEDKSAQAIERYFSPEFRNRLTATLHFNSLSKEVVEKIVDKMIGQLADRLKAKKVIIELTPQARKFIAKKGYDKQLGARPIQRLIEEEITKKLSQEILFGDLSSGSGNVKIVVKDGELGFELIDN
ncbi:MAG: ATP-dependent Clp protease ATP-binding subunit ClpA [Candidatus Dadabacteria bacterium]|nr:MAG: ATP-dependent Clp protease ATP-binding subunit ClpA [Candidatus Dadabacteria bacterium]TDJ01735.1 MAG: ATP-dependent Clp protease ATP-binding subunit ClpA [Candidatus Dadabacteria bacterium]